MANAVLLQVEGKHYGVDPVSLPPVGTHVFVHKHLTANGVSLTVEVVEHEWRLEEPSGEDESAELAVHIKTRVVPTS